MQKYFQLIIIMKKRNKNLKFNFPRFLLCEKAWYRQTMQEKATLGFKAWLRSQDILLPMQTDTCCTFPLYCECRWGWQQVQDHFSEQS